MMYATTDAWDLVFAGPVDGVERAREFHAGPLAKVSTFTAMNSCLKAC